MEYSWEGFLNILKLNENVRGEANLSILLEFPLGNPKESLLLKLYESIKTLYKTDNYFSIVWFKESANNPDISYLEKKIISKNDTKYIQDLWLTLAGHYILFLPKTFNVNKMGNGDEEELIGKILSEYRQLLLKTPDGNEILYLYLNKL